MQLHLRICPKTWQTVVASSLAYLAIVIMAAGWVFYAPSMGPAHAGAGGWRAATDVLVGLGGLYIAIWIIALATLWVRREEHKPS